jgi:putative molybdopterin biosynthesis protein
MNDYMTTDEVAKYLRLNPKKIYALLAEGQMPAARVSGKWLFPKKLIDRWVEDNTVYPMEGLIGAFMDRMLIFQGSDDWFLSRVLSNLWEKHKLSVASAKVGSLAGLKALKDGLAHISGFHVGDKNLVEFVKKGQSLYVIDYARRSQGLIYNAEQTGVISSLEEVIDRSLRFAYRQKASGTYRLTEKIFKESKADMTMLPLLGPFTSHQEVAHAVKTGEADVGIGIQIVAEMLGLDFLPLVEEEYKLGVPGYFFGNPSMDRFMNLFLEESKMLARRQAAGYSFASMGKMEIVNNIH